MYHSRLMESVAWCFRCMPPNWLENCIPWLNGWQMYFVNSDKVANGLSPQSWAHPGRRSLRAKMYQRLPALKMGDGKSGTQVQKSSVRRRKRNLINQVSLLYWNLIMFKSELAQWSSRSLSLSTVFKTTYIISVTFRPFQVQDII